MPRKKEYNREEVLQKAMHVFWNQGYKTTSVRELEKQMGINQFSIYAAFQNKEALFLEVMEEYRQWVKDHFLQKIIHSEGELADLNDFLLSFGKSIAKGEYPEGCLMVNTTLSLNHSDQKIARKVKFYFNYLGNIFFNYLQKAKNKGRLNQNFDCRKNAEFLLVNLQGLAVYAKHKEESAVSDYVEIIMSHFKK